MSHQLHNSLTRILTADGSPVGVGFLSAENLILTCAHVIEQAIGQVSSSSQDLVVGDRVQYQSKIFVKVSDVNYG